MMGSASLTTVRQVHKFTNSDSTLIRTNLRQTFSKGTSDGVFCWEFNRLVLRRSVPVAVMCDRLGKRVTGSISFQIKNSYPQQFFRFSNSVFIQESWQQFWLNGKILLQFGHRGLNERVFLSTLENSKKLQCYMFLIPEAYTCFFQLLPFIKRPIAIFAVIFFYY